jgi:hypothetical protein
MGTIDEFNADLTARVGRYRARARYLRAAAEVVCTARRLELLDLAEAFDGLADAIDLFRISD